MVVSKQLKKQIIIEIIALIFLIGVIVYAIFAIDKSNKNNITSQDGLVLVLDDTKFNGLVDSSDGIGLNTLGVTYTITNNNKNKVTYDIIVTPSVKDDDVLKQIRVSSGDIKIEDLTKLKKINDGYVVDTYTLEPGYTKIHLFKYWYKIGTDKKIVNQDIEFSYKVVRK